MKSLMPILLILVILFGCSTDSGEELPEPEPMETHSIKNVSFGEDTVRFKLVNIIPEPCWTFHSTEINPHEKSIWVTVLAQRTTNGACQQVISTIEPEVSIPVTSGNTYQFRFWKTHETTLDTTITIP